MKTNQYQKLHDEFLPRVGSMFDGGSEHWSEREAVKPIWTIKGEILEVKPNGICIDDGKGDETFVSFDTIAKHRSQLQRDYKFDIAFAIDSESTIASLPQ